MYKNNPLFSIESRTGCKIQYSFLFISFNFIISFHPKVSDWAGTLHVPCTL